MYGEFDWGGFKVDLDRIPEAVRKSFIERTLAHKLGNEVAATVTRLKADFKPKDEGDEFDEELTTEDLRKKMLDRIYEGSIGLRVGGPRGSTVENIAWELAMKQAEATLAPKGYWPKADRKAGIKAEDATIEFAGRAMTREELTDMVFEKYKDKLMADAKEEHARRMEKAKLAKANAVKAVDKVEQSIDALI